MVAEVRWRPVESGTGKIHNYIYLYPNDNTQSHERLRPSAYVAQPPSFRYPMKKSKWHDKPVPSAE